MSKKEYQKRLPAILPPEQRRAPELEALPPAPPETRERREAETEAEADTGTASSPPDPTGDTGRRSRWTAVAWVALMVLAAVAVGGLLTVLLRMLLDGGPGAPEPRTEPAVSPVDPPPEKSYVEASVQADGGIVVRQWIQSEEPVKRILLALPEVPDDVSLEASNVQVVVEGKIADGPQQITDERVIYRFPPSTFVQVRYRLTGAVSESDSIPGRALALATSLDVRYSPRPRRETRVVIAPAVLSLSCTASATGELVPCGIQEGETWKVELKGPRIHDRVVAQVDLGGE